MIAISAEEQFLIELTNRARLDPQAEAAKYGISLNDGLAAGTITAAPKQVLAPNQALDRASYDHSLWMLNTDVFSHTGVNGSSPRQRMEAAGYTLSGQWTTGENLAFSGTTGSINLQEAVLEHHEGLFLSAGHRVNTLNGSFREVGTAQVTGVFTVDGVNYNASMTTMNFAKTGTNTFVTGVAYTDNDGDRFYDIGEGRAGISFSSGTAESVSQAAGGYSLEVSGTGNIPVRIVSGLVSIDVAVDVSKGNVKLDLIGTDLLLSSSNIGLGDGGKDVTLIGVDNVYALGNESSNLLTGNSGVNTLNGNGGNDVLLGLGGNDTLNGGNGNDSLNGGAGNDRSDGGTGNDTIFGEDGDDLIVGSSGDDILDGGNGKDIVTFSGSVAAVVDLRLTTSQNTGHGNDLLLLIEDLGGTSLNDTFNGSEAVNVLYGNAGNDALNGYGGSDRLVGGDGNDRIDGGAGNDVIEGGNGDDTLLGGAGNDRMLGGAGIDTITFTGLTSVTVSLANTAQQNTGHGLDMILDIENIGSSSGNDRLTGSSAANAIYGNAGSDVMEGAGGADTLVGGTQADTFIFRAGHGTDRVNDFKIPEADRLQIDDALWGGGLSAAQVVSAYASVVSGAVMLDFGGGNSIALLGVTSLNGLSSQIDLI